MQMRSSAIRSLAPFDGARCPVLDFQLVGFFTTTLGECGNVMPTTCLRRAAPMAAWHDDVVSCIFGSYSTSPCIFAR
jgi:hypothetical protein